MSEKDSARSRLAEQEIWRKRLAAAEQVYREASHSLRSVLEEKQEDRIAEMRERKLAARTEYLRVLRIFTDLVLRGKTSATE